MKIFQINFVFILLFNNNKCFLDKTLIDLVNVNENIIVINLQEFFLT
jgi:hypothetical protein